MTGGYKSLDEVARLFGIEVEHLHRAKADAHLALAVLRAMAYG